MSEAELLIRDASSYLKPEDVRQLQLGLRVLRSGPRRPVPPLRRALHLPSGRGRQHPDAVAPGLPGADRRPAARRDGGHHRHQERDQREVRQAGGRAGRRRLQAGQDRVREPGAGAGGELPQDVPGDGARRARHPDQARRPPAQHAHAGRDAPEEAGAHRPRDAGDLRADRQPAGAERAVPGAAGTVVPEPLSQPLPGAQERAVEAQRGNRKEVVEKILERDQAAPGGRRHRGAGQRAREESLQHLQEDAGQEPVLLQSAGHLRVPRHRQGHARLLPGAGRAAPAVQADPGQVQGLHRHPQGQRLPVAAHHAVRPLRQPDRDPDPHRWRCTGSPRPAWPRTGCTRAPTPA